MINYNNTTLITRKISKVQHRDGNTSSLLIPGHLRLEVPIISSPMPDVTNGRMAGELANTGILGLIHRFQRIDQQRLEYLNALQYITNDRYNNMIGIAIGVTGDYEERFKSLYAAGCRIFCLDTANGANTQMGEAITNIRSHIFPIPRIKDLQGKFDLDEYNELTRASIILIAGNVMTAEGYDYLQDKVEAVRVGVASGAVCETRTETGMYMPTLESVKECVELRKEIITYNPEAMPAAIIADGGIRTPGDMCKALVAGADAVMCGSVLAGTRESPGDVIMTEDGRKKKLYRGAASFSVQRDNDPDREITYNEGRESFVEYKGSVIKIIKRFQAGLRSSMSYADATNLHEYRNNAILTVL